jgi:hypothetical protein
VSEGQPLPAASLRYGGKGFEFTTASEDFLLHLESRLQFRCAFPGDEDPLTFAPFTGPDRPGFKVNRARLKVGGHGFESWLKYYWEYELSQGNLLDFRLTLAKFPF